MDTFLATVFLIVCVLLIIVVLLQKGRGVGLGGAFGGMGSSAFGTKTGDFFTWVTIVLVSVFLLLSIGATWRFRPAPSQVSQPVFYPLPGPIDKFKLVTVQCRTPKAEMYYTLDRGEPSLQTEPTRRSTKYDSPVRLEPGTILRAKAFLRGWEDSTLAIGMYLLPGPTFSPPPGTISADTPVTIRTNLPGATIRYTLDGSEPTTASPAYTGPVTVKRGDTLVAVAFIPGANPSAPAGGRYTAEATSAPATGPTPRPTTLPAGR